MTLRSLRTWTRSILAPLVVAALVGACGCGSSQSSQPAQAVAEDAAKVKAKAELDAKLEAQRLADLWSYTEVPVGKNRQLAAQINSTNDVETDGKQPHSVMLVFRDHPAWGRSSYLVLQAGDFQCQPGCSVKVTVDQGAPKVMAARRPQTDEAIAMFLNDWRSLWHLTNGAKQLTIEFPVKAGGTRTATFDVSGLDRTKMPGWDAK